MNDVINYDLTKQYINWYCDKIQSCRDMFDNDLKGKTWYELAIIITNLRKEKEEIAKQIRKRAAEIAWKMQMENFGGGTAIGNEIEQISI